MHPPPSPCGPDPEKQSATLQALQTGVDELLRISEEILAQGAQPEMPTLNQLVLRRGRLLNDIHDLPLAALPPDAQANVLEKLIRCQELDQKIGKQMVSHKNEWDGQLKNLKDTQALLVKYRATGPRPTATRDEKA